MSAAPISSPCINVCRMDDATGWCAGCLRTLDEIATWSLLDEAEKQTVVQALASRRMHGRRPDAAAPAVAGSVP